MDPEASSELGYRGFAANATLALKAIRACVYVLTFPASLPAMGRTFSVGQDVP
jgi:hypothetical protein